MTTTSDIYPNWFLLVKIRNKIDPRKDRSTHQQAARGTGSGFARPARGSSERTEEQ